MKSKGQPDGSNQPGLNLRADTSGCPPERISELIQKRAYEFFEARGRLPGHELEDWLRAENEIRKHLGIEP